MKKFVCCIMLFLMVASFCFVPKIYARANTISNAEIEEIAPDNSGNDLENNVVQDLEIEDVGEVEIAELSAETTGSQSVANSNEHRIDYSELLSGMNIFPYHTGHNECGMVAMGFLLQFYNDLPTKYQGQYIPDNMNYAKGNSSFAQTRADALRDDLIGRTNKFLYGWFGLQNATSPNEQFDGLVSYRDTYCQGMGITVNEWFLAYGMKNKIVDLIENNIPVLVTALSFSYEDGTSVISCDVPHAFVVYGYRYKNGSLQFLSHLGWDPVGNGVCAHAARWVNIDWLAGFVYLSNVPLSNFTAEKSANGENTYITGLNNPSEEDFEIPQHLLGRTVTKIDNNAFEDCDNIKSIIIPNTVTSIGDDVFKDCTNLTSIVIPATVTEIGDGVFDGCVNLTSITLPTTITKISDRMFKGCVSLANFTIELNVTEIGEDAFRDCTGFTSMEIPVTVTEIGNGVFDGCVNLTSVTPLTTITKISDRMFKGCVSLANFKIEPNITEIGEDAFRDCTGFTSMEIPETVTEIGDGVFDGCVNLTSVTPLTTITKISDRMFKGCVSLTSFTIAQNITEIGASAFMGTNIRDIVIPNTVTNIGSGAFSYCGNLIEIKILEGISVLPNETFYNCYNLTNVVLPNSLTHIGASAFYGCENLTSIELPSLLDRISSNAFSFSGLQEIEIPDSVTSMGNEVFYHCTNLTEVTLSASLDSIGDWTFRESGIQQITIPTGIVSIGEDAFASCHNLISVELPNSLLLIEKNAFCDTGIEEIEIPYGVSIIRECAFSSCYSLTKVVLPNSLTQLGQYAFFECIQLNSINIPTSLTTIKEETFLGCVNLGQVIIHSAVLTIEDGAFVGCLQSALYVEEYGERPSGWSSSWATGCRVVWNTTLSSDKSYVVSFYKQSGFSGDSSYLASPTREGFLFVGWYLSPNFTSSSISQEDIIAAPSGCNYYARWQSEEENIPQTVNIEYKDVGNTRFSGVHAVGYPTTHTNGVDTVLTTPSRLDYFFMGWFVDSEGIGQEITVIYGDNVYTETITLYAKWKKVSFTPIIRPDFVNAELLTANGSYIDSQGNVYLVEEDIDAYLNGTLTFYKKDENLETI